MRGSVAIPISVEDLEAVARLVAKDEPRPRLRIAAEVLANEHGKLVETLPHVGRFKSQIDRCSREVQHDDVSPLGEIGWTKAANNVCSVTRSASGTVTTCPDGQRTLIT